MRAWRSPTPSPLGGAAGPAGGAGDAPVPPPRTPARCTLPPPRRPAWMCEAPGFPERQLSSCPGADGRAAFFWLDLVLSRSRFTEERRFPRGRKGCKPAFGPVSDPGRRSPLGCLSIRYPFWPPTSENVPGSRFPSGRDLVSHSIFKAELFLTALQEQQLNLYLQIRQKSVAQNVSFVWGIRALPSERFGTKPSVPAGSLRPSPPGPQHLKPRGCPAAAKVSPGLANGELNWVVN